MKRPKFWRYLKYFLWVLFPLNLLWQFWFNRPNREFWAVYGLLMLTAAGLLLVVVIFTNRYYNPKMKKGTQKIISAAVELGYSEPNVMRLNYAISPASEQFRASVRGYPILVWDQEKFGLFAHPRNAKNPYQVMSCNRTNSQITLRRIVPIHPFFGEPWGFQLDIRYFPLGENGLQSQEHTIDTWQFVPFSGSGRDLNKAAVLELLVKLDSATKLPTPPG